MPDSKSQFTHFSPYEIKDGEEYMNADQKDHFRHVLMLWKQQLMEEVDSTITHLQEEASNHADPRDRKSTRLNSSH